MSDVGESECQELLFGVSDCLAESLIYLNGTVLDYDTSFKPPAQDALYEANAYRSSDHDPVIVGLALHPTFDRVCELTEAYVTKAGIANALCTRTSTSATATKRRTLPPPASSPHVS